MTILITGVAGMIGANFAEYLIAKGHKIIGIDDLSGGYIENVHKDVIFFNRNISKEIIDDIFDEYEIDTVYHFAAYAAEGRSNYIRTFNHFNNTISTSNVINACVNYKAKLIFTSSVAVYSGIPPFTENTLPNPIDEYGVSKYCSELSIKIAGETQGLEWVIVRPRNVYGEKQSIFDPARNVMGIWMYQILNGLPMTIFGDGSNKRTFTYIYDILEPLLKANNLNHEIINLGSDKAYTIKEANDILCNITGYKNIVNLESRHEVAEAICDIKKSENMLQFKQIYSLEDGLKRMWNWAQSIPMREKRNPPVLEVITHDIHSSLIQS